MIAITTVTFINGIQFTRLKNGPVTELRRLNNLIKEKTISILSIAKIMDCVLVGQKRIRYCTDNYKTRFVRPFGINYVFGGFLTFYCILI